MGVRHRISRLEHRFRPGEKIRQIVIIDFDHGNYRMNDKPITEAEFRTIAESDDYQIVMVYAPDEYPEGAEED